MPQSRASATRSDCGRHHRRLRLSAVLLSLGCWNVSHSAVRSLLRPTSRRLPRGRSKRPLGCRRWCCSLALAPVTRDPRIASPSTIPAGRRTERCSTAQSRAAQPASFAVNEVIAGWTEGLQMMVEGEKRRFWIPESLAYKGQSGSPQGMLVFDVELIKIQ